MRVGRLTAVMLVVGVLLGALAAPALAAGAGAEHVPFALLGVDFPSVKSIVHDVIRFFFSTLLDALVPDWLKHAAVSVIKRLVTVPNPTDARTWPTLAKLAQGMRWIAVPLLSLAAIAGWAQQWAREMTGRPSSLDSVLARTVLAAVLLVVYPVFLGQAVALVNSITNAMLSLPAVADGLARTVGLVFAGTLLSGDEVLLALLGIAAVVLGVGLFMLDVGLLVIFALLFVSAPLAIVCSVVDETRGVWSAWRYALLTALLVPIGWCILFATAGAFMLDMTRWSGGIAGTLGARFVGVFGAILILWLAVRWPLMLWSTIRLHIGGALGTVGARATTSGTGPSGGGRTARAALAQASMAAGTRLTGGLNTARSYAATSARMALGDGARLAGRLPGAQAARDAAGRLTAPAAAGVAPALAAAAPLAQGAQQTAASVGERALKGRVAAKSALAAGASTREAAQAAIGAIAQPKIGRGQVPQSRAGVQRDHPVQEGNGRSTAGADGAARGGPTRRTPTEKVTADRSRGRAASDPEPTPGSGVSRPARDNRTSRGAVAPTASPGRAVVPTGSAVRQPSSQHSDTGPGASGAPAVPARPVPVSRPLPPAQPPGRSSRKKKGR